MTKSDSEPPYEDALRGLQIRPLSIADARAIIGAEADAMTDREVSEICWAVQRFTFAVFGLYESQRQASERAQELVDPSGGANRP